MLQEYIRNSIALISESKQSIIGLGYPEIIAKILYKKFGNKAPLIARWMRDYNKHKEGKDWFEKSFSSWSTRSMDLIEMIDAYNASKLGFEAYSQEVRKHNIEPQIEEFDQETTKAWAQEIEEKFLNDIFFYSNDLVKAVLEGKIKDLKPYKNLSLQDAEKRFYERTTLKSDAIKEYENGWKWINVGKKCSIIGREMSNCGSAGVMSADADRTMIVLYDDNNNPKVVVTYSPNEKRLSGVEGKGSTAVKRKYISYVMDLSNHMGVPIDTTNEKSYMLKMKNDFKGLLKSIEPFDEIKEFGDNEIFELVTNDGELFLGNKYNILSYSDFYKIQNLIKKHNEENERKISKNPFDWQNRDRFGKEFTYYGYHQFRKMLSQDE